MVRNSGPKRVRRAAAQKQGSSYSGVSAPKCRRDPCDNATWDPSGYCQHHRSGSSDTPATLRQKQAGNEVLGKSRALAPNPDALAQRSEILGRYEEGGVALVTSEDGRVNVLVFTTLDDPDLATTTEDQDLTHPGAYEDGGNLPGHLIRRAGDHLEDLYIESDEVPGHVSGSPIMLSNLREGDSHWIQESRRKDRARSERVDYEEGQVPSYRTYDVDRKFLRDLRENPELVRAIPSVGIRDDSRYSSSLKTHLSDGSSVGTYLPDNRRDS